MPHDDLAEHIAEVGGDGEVAAFVALLLRQARPLAVDWPPLTPPPMIIMALPWPWSVPRLPFSVTARPNSDIVSDDRVRHAIAEIAASAAMPREKSSRRVGELAVRGAFVDVVIPAADVRRTRSRGRHPTLISCAICCSACPNGERG